MRASGKLDWRFPTSHATLPCVFRDRPFKAPKTGGYAYAYRSWNGGYGPTCKRSPATAIAAALALSFLGAAGCGSSSPLEPSSGSSPPQVDDARRTILHHIESDDLPQDEVLSWIDFADEVKRSVKRDLSIGDRFSRALRNPWVAFGFLAQATFMMRFVLQIIASERKKRSYVPVAFWYLSLVGGLMLFTYALARRDPVFVVGQGLGLFIYARNLVLIYRRRGAFEGALAERNRRNGQAAAADVDTP